MKLYGIDLGGTKIEGAVIDPKKPDHALCRLRVPTGSHRGYAHVIGQIVRLVAMLERESGTRRPPCIGFGTPGVVDPGTGVLKNSNSLCLNGRRLREDLGAHSGSRRAPRTTRTASPSPRRCSAPHAAGGSSWG